MARELDVSLNLVVEVLLLHHSNRAVIPLRRTLFGFTQIQSHVGCPAQLLVTAISIVRKEEVMYGTYKQSLGKARYGKPTYTDGRPQRVGQTKQG